MNKQQEIQLTQITTEDILLNPYLNHGINTLLVICSSLEP